MHELNVESLGLDVLEVTEERGTLTARVIDSAVDNTPRCPFCGAASIKYGTRLAHYRDLPHDGKPVVLSWKRRRYQCTSLYPAVGRVKCGRIFSDYNPAMDEKRLMTARLADHVGRQSLNRPFQAVAEEVGVDDQTVRQVFSDWSSRNTVSASTANVPRKLAILSLDILKRPRPVFADVEEETLIDILPSADESKLLDSLSEFRNPEAVEAVLVDLEDGYVDAAREMFPSAELAINLDHVMRLFNEAFAEELTRIRRSLPDRLRRAVLNDPTIMRQSIRTLDVEQRAVLDYWFERLPNLETVFSTREKFLDFVEADDREAAAAAFDTWQATATAFAESSLGLLFPKTELRRSEMLNSSTFKTPRSFGRVVSALQDAIRTDAKGQAFDVRRAKLLSRLPSGAAPRSNYKADRANREPGSGIHIPTLVEEWTAVGKQAV
jgi:transposase